MKNLIYTAEQVQRTIVRMAYEIYEHNHTEQEIVIAGIQSQGFELANRIGVELAAISPIKVKLLSVSIDKSNPFKSDVLLEGSDNYDLDSKVLILVDDVLNSGKTFAFCLKALLEYNFSKVETAVLVNRSHKRYPISAKYKGYDLSTTITNHVEVQLADPFSIFLY
jgi:pyrimidine operon attenuation protein/uracil phosphoribosyltransferase